MTRTRLGFIVVAASVLAFTAEEGNSAFNPAGALKERAVAATLVQKANGCHSNCLWGWYKAGNGKTYLGCHRNTWSCAFASPCNPKACRWWHWWHG